MVLCSLFAPGLLVLGRMLTIVLTAYVQLDLCILRCSSRDWNQSCRYYSWFETTKSMIQEGPSNLTPGRHIVPPRICGDFLLESERGKGNKGERKERAHTIHNSRTYEISRTQRYHWEETGILPRLEREFSTHQGTNSSERKK